MAIWYIGPGGNDTTGNGTQGNPWLTVSKAESAASPGDGLVCLAGTVTFASQTFANLASVSGAGSTSSVLDGFGAGVNWQASGVFSISGITIQNAKPPSNNSIFARGGNATWTFASCAFNNLIAGTQTYEPIFGAWDHTAAFNFSVCLFFNCAADSSFQNQQVGLFGQAFGTTAISLANCTIYSDVATGLTLPIVSGGGDVSLTNTIIANGNGTSTAFSVGSSPTYSGSKNDIFGFTSPPSLTGDISADPLFVDPANGNFNLRPTSPCIDAGTAI